MEDLLTQLPRALREAIESAGYRVVRWAAARKVLQARIAKGRITGGLGAFLAHWLSLAPLRAVSNELWLTFDGIPDHVRLVGGGESLVTSPLERALLHLPALRPFWSQELRQQHFEALKFIVPQAWLLDAAAVPPGAEIQGLGITSWERLDRMNSRTLEIRDKTGRVREDLPAALASRDSFLTSRTLAGAKLNAWYERNDKDQVVLRSVEASP
ncbi:hypothetical protein [Prosthecobacter sp.]|uniref:hypothetical protein n=1 Tax=Prosthecobacter sp. TaxID=1965333 RepID=UPI002AB9D23A|nr:hypothetical protein [Prosthecobacter sp.]MDZ4404216.1 hypothetical protein [Prosthecobacter sp.]